MASLLQSESNGTFGGNLTLTWPGNLTTGSVQIVQFHSNQTAAPNSFSDSAGQTWTLATSVVSAGHGSMFVYSTTTGAAAGTAPTVTIDYTPTGGIISAVMAEFTGITTPKDTTATAFAGNTSSVSVGPTGTASGSGYLGLSHIGVIGGSGISAHSGTLADEWGSAFWAQMNSFTVNAATLTATATMTGNDDYVAIATVWPTPGFSAAGAVTLADVTASGTAVATRQALGAVTVADLASEGVASNPNYTPPVMAATVVRGPLRWS